ncbi:MAG: class II fructose-bisphosphate aldolase, partial [Candidatus Yanofskybacteria bacterium]|nr:class II fructose-bisphosphate aldolase [Candidatus Yanofskybacteria bacterium]
MNLNDYLKQAKEGHYAIGHFNFATEDVLKGIIEASRDAGAPAVMVGTSEGEANFVGTKEAVALVGALRADLNFPVFLNADHFKSFEKCKEAIDAGYDSIIIDPAQSNSADHQQKGQTLSGASASNLDERIRITRQVVDYAHSVNPNISVEGELGYLKGSSEVQTKIEISSADYSKPEEVADFVSRTGVDRMAVVFGNIHGIVTDQEEKLDIEHFSKIVAVAVAGASCYGRMPLLYFVLHGASGLKDEDVVASIKAGITNVHFNTELRVAYRNEIDKQFHAHPTETTPYKYLG